MLSVLLCCAAIFAVSTAAPGGAPASACNTVAPQPGSPHLDPNNAQNGLEQPDPNPWTIDICDFDEIGGYYTYTPGNTYTITLRPVLGANVTLRGFLIIGRTQLSNMTMGTFADPAPENNFTQLSMCGPDMFGLGGPDSGVTHNNPGPRDMRRDEPGPFVFTWTAPPAGTGPIWFRYAIMQDVATWWADDSSAAVQEVNNLQFSGAPQLQGVGLWTLLLAAVAVALKTVL